MTRRAFSTASPTPFRRSNFRSHSMSFPRALRLLLVLALLGAWQGALVHLIEHVDPAGAFIHLAGTPEDPDQKASCDALAALANCAPGFAAGALLSFDGLFPPT